MTKVIMKYNILIAVCFIIKKIRIANKTNFTAIPPNTTDIKVFRDRFKDQTMDTNPKEKINKLPK